MDDSKPRVRRGAVRCLNLGIEQSSKDRVILLGDDVSVPPDFIEKVDYVFDRTGAAIIGFNVIDRYNLIRMRHNTEVLMWLLCGQLYPERGDSDKEGTGIYTVSFAIDKSKVSRRFDESYLGSGFNAEFDFLFGQKVFYATGLKVYHSVPKEPYHKVVRRNRSLMMHNRRLFLRKHFRFWRVRMVLYVGYLLLMPVGDFLFATAVKRQVEAPAPD